MKTIINNNIKKHPVVGKNYFNVDTVREKKNLREKRVFGFQTLEV